MPNNTTPQTDVVFRFDSRGDYAGVFALFPGLPGTNDPYDCLSYAHVGQHSAADPHFCVRKSRPATPAEYAPLAAELKRLGYNLRVVRRIGSHYVTQRRAVIRAASEGPHGRNV